MLGILGAETGQAMVDRNLLRKVLMKNLEIQYNKHLTTYESDGQSITVKFKDGSSVRGNLLVGADGSNSRVRANLLEGFVPTPSRAIMLNGSVKLSRSEWEPILKEGSGESEHVVATKAVSNIRYLYSPLSLGIY